MPTHKSPQASSLSLFPFASTASLGATRRSLLVGGAAGGAALALSAVRAPVYAEPRLATIPALSSQKVLQSIGFNASPNMLKTNYQYYNSWIPLAAGIGMTYFRGTYAAGLPATLQVVSQARSHGLGWGMTVAPNINTTPSQIAATISHIAANAADICIYIEGINQPNVGQGTTAPPPNWKQQTVAIQQAIYQAVRSDPRLSNVRVLGPSLMETLAVPQDYTDLKNLGLLNYMDVIGMHRYPGGHYPDKNMDARISFVSSVWPGKPFWITEHGYNNALASRSVPVPESVAAEYAPASVLEAADRGVNLAWFELLDDPDPSNANAKYNFGFVALTSTGTSSWRPKPIVASVRNFLSLLSDPGPAYTAGSVPFQMTSSIADVRATVTQKRDGSAMAHLRRATDCWNPAKKTPISVAKAQVTVTSAKGSQTVFVDHRTTSVPL